MSRNDPSYSRISPRFWSQAQEEGWTDDMVLLGLYLLTCEHRTTEGIFRLPLEYMVADMPSGWSLARVSASLDALGTQGFVAYDHKARVVFLPKAMKYQRPDNQNQQTAAIRNLKSLPKTDLFQAFLEAAEAYCPAFHQALLEALPQALTQGLVEPSLARARGVERSQALALTPALTPAPALGRTLCAREDRALVSSATDQPVDKPDEPAPDADPNPPYSGEFEAFWVAYPRKEEKRKAWRAWKARLKTHVSAKGMTKAARNYAAGCEGAERRFIKLPATFIGPDMPFTDWVAGVPPGCAPNNGRGLSAAEMWAELSAASAEEAP